MNLPPELEGWRDLAEEITGWITGYWVSERAFDAMVRGKAAQPAKARAFSEGMLILGELSGARKELDLLQHLCRLGICEAREERGLMWYRKVPEPIR